MADTWGTEIKEDISYYTSRMIFIVVPASEVFPATLGMQQVPDDYFMLKINQARKSLPYHPDFEPNRPTKKFLTKLSTKIGRLLNKLG